MGQPSDSSEHAPEERATAQTAESAYSEGPFQPARSKPLLERTIPVSQELPEYQARTGRRDLLAGLTVAALALPSAMAYAEVAGLSPASGLYALLLPTIAYTLLGSSKQLIIGPEGSISALVAAAVLPLAAAGSAEATEMAAMLALLVAACFLAGWALRIGWIADYFSRPVLIGYIHGVVIVLIVGQLGKLFGLSIDERDPIPQLLEVLGELDESSWLTIAVAAAALGLLLPMRYLAPRLPAALIVVVAAIAISWVFDLEGEGVAVVGDIPAGLPNLSFPLPPRGDTLELLPAAVGIFLVSFADGILTARSFAGNRGQHVSASQELLAFAAANAGGGLSQGLPIGASGSRTAVNDGMGARTQLAGFAAAIVVAVILLFLTDPIAYLPSAVLGAIIISAAIGLVDLAAWRSLWVVRRGEVAIGAITLAGVVAVGVLQALFVAVALTIVDAVRRSATPHDAVLGWVKRLGRYANVALHPSARLTPGVVVYRLDDRLFFANARYVKGRVSEAINGAPYPVAWLVFDADAMTHVDSTGLEALRELTEGLRRDGIKLVVSRLRGFLASDFAGAGLTEIIGRDRFYPTVRAAVEACAAASGQDTAASGTSLQ